MATGPDPRAHGAYPTVFAQPSPGTPAAVGHAPAAEPHFAVPRLAPREPTLARTGRAVWPWVWAIIALAGLAALAYFLFLIGPVGSAIGLVLATIPFVLVVLVLMWLDRWEPEPKGLVVFALAWGAFVSVVGTLAIGLMIDVVWPAAASTAAFGPVVRAPIVEELLKCLGILLIYAMGRRTFDGALDGVVYGALIGAGFAFVENIQYFAVALAEGGAAQLTATFILRGLVSPFAHLMFTAVCGFAIGLAVRKGKGVFGPWVLGLIGAVALHAFWNGSSVYAGFFVPYLLLQVPFFILFVFGAIGIRREELRIRRERLEDYVRAGWFTSDEADMLSTRQGRKQALAWAATRPSGSATMKAFIHDGARLAWARQRALTGRDRTAAEDERVLLQRMVLARQRLLSA